jgi:hypothetical protein
MMGIPLPLLVHQPIWPVFSASTKLPLEVVYSPEMSQVKRLLLKLQRRLTPGGRLGETRLATDGSWLASLVSELERCGCCCAADTLADAPEVTRSAMARSVRIVAEEPGDRPFKREIVRTAGSLRPVECVHI